MNLPDGCDRDALFDFLLSTAVPELADIRSRYRLRQTADNEALGRAAMVGLHDPNSTKRLAALTALAMRRMTPKCCPIAARLLASTTLRVGPGSRGGALLGAMSAVALREKVSSLIAALAPGEVTWLTQDGQQVTGRAEEVLKLVASQAGEGATLCPVSPAFPEPDLELLSSVVDELAMCVDQQLTETEWARWILVEGRLVRTPPPPPPGMILIKPWPVVVDHRHEVALGATGDDCEVDGVGRGCLGVSRRPCPTAGQSLVGLVPGGDRSPAAADRPAGEDPSPAEPYKRLSGKERSLFDALLARGPGRYVDGDDALIALLCSHAPGFWKQEDQGRAKANARATYSNVNEKLASWGGGYQLLPPDPSRRHPKGGRMGRYGIKG